MRNNEFDQAINQSLKSKSQDLQSSSVRSKKRINYNNYFDDSDSDHDDGDWRNNKKKLKKKRRRLGKRIKKLRQRKTKQKEMLSEIEQLLKWRDLIEYQDQPLPLNCYSMHQEECISGLNLENYAQQIQALLLTPHWATKDNSAGTFTLADLQSLQISKKVMKNGIVWLWSEKEYLSEIIAVMSRKNFTYIENVNIVQLNAERSVEYLTQEQRVLIDNEMNRRLLTTANPNLSSEEQSTKEDSNKQSQEQQQQQQQQQPPSKINDNGIEEWADEIDLIQEQLAKGQNVKALDVLDEKYKKDCYFKQCRQIILMFRRFDKENKFLELRHQRTADVFFDMSNEVQGKISWKAREFIYNQIETLLPKAQLQVNEEGEVDQNFQMLELWGDYRMPRLGWITICEKPAANNSNNTKDKNNNNSSNNDQIPKKANKRGRKKKTETQNQEKHKQIPRVLKKKIKKEFKI